MILRIGKDWAVDRKFRNKNIQKYSGFLYSDPSMCSAMS